MKSWTKETALSELETLVKEIDNFSRQRRFSTDHTRWIVKTLTFLEEVFGRESRYYLTFASLSWQETGTFLVSIPNPEGDEEWGAPIFSTTYNERLPAFSTGCLTPSTWFPS